MKRTLFATIAASSLLLTACGGGSETEPEATDAATTAVEDASSPAEVEAGETNAGTDDSSTKESSEEESSDEESTEVEETEVESTEDTGGSADAAAVVSRWSTGDCPDAAAVSQALGMDVPDASEVPEMEDGPTGCIWGDPMGMWGVSQGNVPTEPTLGIVSSPIGPDFDPGADKESILTDPANKVTDLTEYGPNSYSVQTELPDAGDACGVYVVDDATNVGVMSVVFNPETGTDICGAALALVEMP